MKKDIHNFSSKKSQYSLVIITLNEGERLLNQLTRLRPYSDLVDIIIVDGKSSDGSTGEDILKSFQVRSVITVHERGLGAATRLGLKYSLDEGYKGVVTMDGNGKDGVEALPFFIKGLEDGFDLVQGGRFLKGGFHKNTPIDRLIGIRLIMAPLIALSTGYWFNDPTNAFRGLSSELIQDERIKPFRSEFVHFNFQIYLLYQAARNKLKIHQIPVSRVYPDDGTIPTKIVGWRIKFNLFQELCKTILGYYNP